MSGIRFSVLIPAYNHADYLEEAVLSVCAGPDTEILVLDDGSEDATPESASRLQEEGLISFSRQENVGADATLNRLLEKARGDYCFILNSDDRFEPGRLSRLSEELERHPEAVMAASFIRIIDGEGHQLGIKEAWRNMPPWALQGPSPYLEDLENPDLALLQSNWVSTTSNLAFRRKQILDLGLKFSKLRYCHDWDFLLQCLHYGSMALVEKSLVSYRVHGTNTIREGKDAASGQALMQWEILWTLARHAAILARRHGDAPRLRERLTNSLPCFGRKDLLFELLALRGEGKEPPPAYDALLDESNPFRRALFR